jgi:hypothetical protein
VIVGENEAERDDAEVRDSIEGIDAEWQNNA